jgi:plasmid stability protein
MPDILVRNVDKGILAKLKERARRNDRSLQNELTQVFKSLVDDEALSDEETAAKIKKSLRGRNFSDSAVLLREDRGR